MNPFFQHIIIQTVNRKHKQSKLPIKQYDKEVLSLQVEIIHLFRDGFFIVIGVLSALISKGGKKRPMK